MINFLLVNGYLLPRVCMTKIGLVSLVSPANVFDNVIFIVFSNSSGYYLFNRSVELKTNLETV